MKKILFLILTLSLFLTSCETMEHWLFNASDYHLIESKTEAEEDVDEETIFWDDVDYDLWFDENEYD